MFIIDEKQNIHLSRGDVMDFNVEFVDVNTGEKYIFQSGDKLTFTVAKNLRKIYTYQVTKYIEGPTDTVNFNIDNTLWLNECADIQELEYDVILNDQYSVICYDLNGAKKLYLYPRTYEEGVE
jgi:hypothetical protein